MQLPLVQDIFDYCADLPVTIKPPEDGSWWTAGGYPNFLTHIGHLRCPVARTIMCSTTNFSGSISLSSSISMSIYVYIYISEAVTSPDIVLQYVVDFSTGFDSFLDPFKERHFHVVGGFVNICYIPTEITGRMLKIDKTTRSDIQQELAMVARVVAAFQLEEWFRQRQKRNLTSDGSDGEEKYETHRNTLRSNRSNYELFPSKKQMLRWIVTMIILCQKH